MLYYIYKARCFVYLGEGFSLVITNQREAPAISSEAISARVNKYNGIPIYLQIAQVIREFVKVGGQESGARLPTETELCQVMGISKMTLRHALEPLVHEGIIERRRGVGTFVSIPKLDKNLPEMRSFSEEIAARNKVASSRLLHFETSPPSFQAKSFFGLPEGDMVYSIQRLRFADGVPIAIETVELPAHLFPDLKRFDLQVHSLYRIMEETYRIQFTRCSEQISAAMPNLTQQKLLSAEGHVALLVIKRRSYAGNSIPVELSTTEYRGDLYTATIEAVRISALHRPA